jgi:fumarylacetoacetase
VINRTHDPALRSWVQSANEPGCDFPVQNLPFGVFERRDHAGVKSVCVAIGDYILDIGACVREGLIAPGPAADACSETTVNRLMAREPSALSQFRAELSEVLSETGAQADRAKDASKRILVPISLAALDLPVQVGDYTDFYASVHHATNVGS